MALEKYMLKNKINKRSVAIKDCVYKILSNYQFENSMYEISEKLNRILYRQNMNKKLLEQIFVNTGFPINEDIKQDKLLKQFYLENNKYGGFE